MSWLLSSAAHWQPRYWPSSIIQYEKGTEHLHYWLSVCSVSKLHGSDVFIVMSLNKHLHKQWIVCWNYVCITYHVALLWMLMKTKLLWPYVDQWHRCVTETHFHGITHCDYIQVSSKHQIMHAGVRMFFRNVTEMKSTITLSRKWMTKQRVLAFVQLCFYIQT